MLLGLEKASERNELNKLRLETPSLLPMLRVATRACSAMPAFTSVAPAVRLARHCTPPPALAVSAAQPTRAFFGAVLRRRRARLSALKVLRAAVDGAPESAVVEEEVDPGSVKGTDLRVLRYPHPLLRKENVDVEEAEMADVKRIAKEMLLVMYASKGVGLAAPQVGINKRLMVFNPEGEAKAWLQEVVLVNPSIVGKSKPTGVDGEGCLSFPGMGGEVRRHDWVKVEATRLNGKKFKVKYEGWKARIFQHEFDHLDGVLYIDRLEAGEMAKVERRLEELVDDYRESPYEGLEPAC